MTIETPIAVHDFGEVLHLETKDGRKLTLTRAEWYYLARLSICDARFQGEAELEFHDRQATTLNVLEELQETITKMKYLVRRSGGNELDKPIELFVGDVLEYAHRFYRIKAIGEEFVELMIHDSKMVELERATITTTNGWRVARNADSESK